MEDLTKLTDKELDDLIVEYRKILPDLMGSLYRSIVSDRLEKLEAEKARRQREKEEVCNVWTT